jgi:serine/threonine protein kinase
MDPLLNTYIGQYLLTAVVGRSNTSVVYKAYQASLDRNVAVKVLQHNLAAHVVARFEREARAIAALQHRNILPIFDYGTQGRLHYFVTQYVADGISLAHLLAKGPLDELGALRLMAHVLGALDYAHNHGIIHRDIKPSNILMPSPDWPMLADFGIAKLVGTNQQLTPPGQALGTAAYMAPENAGVGSIDARSDLYSAGVVLYELVTGQVPFTGNGPLDVLAKHVHEEPPPPRGIVPHLHQALEGFLLHALQKHPGDRYQSAAEMTQALARVTGQIERTRAEAWLAHRLNAPPAAPPQIDPYQTIPLPPDAAPAAAPAPTPVPATPAPRRRRLGWGLALVALVGALAVFSWNTTRPRTTDAVTSTPTTNTTGATNPDVTTASTAPPVNEQAPVTPLAEQPALEVPAVETGAGGVQVITLDDAQWQGGYNLSRGSSVYGGRTATWIYGTGSEYSTMEATFQLNDQPVGAAELIVEGMDSEGSAKTPISIEVNGVEIYNGPNPLPDDDLPLESGTWASNTWTVNAALLQAGTNTIRISNRSQGSFGGPPFFMLDYATVRVFPPK